VTEGRIVRAGRLARFGKAVEPARGWR
jgi:hypothetical protein